MTGISRRHFLGRSAAASALSMTGGALAHERASDALRECPDLLRLCDEFDTAFADHRNAVNAQRAAVARFEALAPEVPADLVPNWDERHVAEHATDVFGNYIWKDGTRVMIIQAHCLERDLKVHGFQHRDLRRKLPIAMSYEDSVEKAREASGFDAAAEKVWHIEVAVRQAADQIGQTPALTTLGLIRKASVAHAYAQTSPDNAARAQYLFAQSFWAEIAAVLGREMSA